AALHQAGDLADVSAVGEDPVARRHQDAAGLAVVRLKRRDRLVEPVEKAGLQDAGHPFRRDEPEARHAVAAGLIVESGFVHGLPHTRSTIMAPAIPAAAHKETRPTPSPRASSSSSTVPTSIAPVAPSGWPMAIAPPATLTFSCGTS